MRERIFKFLVQRKPILTEIDERIRSKQEYLTEGEDDVWPGCISFVTSTLNGKNVCFIALSRAAQGEDENLLKLLDELAKDLNVGQTARSSKYYYAVVMETSKSFKSLIHRLSGETRTCAEYDFGSLLSKLFVEYGKNLWVEGCTNAFLFNYEKKAEVQYGKDMHGHTLARVTVHDAYDSPVKKRSKNVELSVGRDQKVTLIPCCSRCQSNKYNFLAALISFQEEGEKFRQIQQESDILEKTDIVPEQTSVTEKRSKRLSTGISGLTGLSMNGFLTSIKPSLPKLKEDEVVAVLS